MVRTEGAVEAGRGQDAGRAGRRPRAPIGHLLATGILCGVAGLAAGTLLESSAIRRGHAGQVAELREDGLTFVRPLLECERPRASPENLELAGIRDRVETLVNGEVAAGRASRVSVYFRDLDVGTWFSVNPGERFVPASLLKVPVLIALLDAMEGDPQLLQRRVRYDGAADLDRDQSVRPAEPLVAGASYSVGELARRMIVHSDNNAARLVLDALPEGALERLYANLGVGFSGSEGGTSLISVDAYATFFRILYNGTYLSRRSNEVGLSLLASRSYQGGLQAGLPAGVRLAAKFGEWRLSGGRADREQLHDCGIVYHPGRPYLLCVMTSGERFEPLSDVIAGISRVVHEQVDAGSRATAAAAGIPAFPPL
jgi:beta-lactamase class A